MGCKKAIEEIDDPAREAFNAFAFLHCQDKECSRKRLPTAVRPKGLARGDSGSADLAHRGSFGHKQSCLREPAGVWAVALVVAWAVA